MKKFTILMALLILIPSVSFAVETGQGGDGPVTIGATNTLDIELSNKVHIVYDGTTHGGDTFALITYHDKGTRQYLSSSEDSVIYWADYVSGSAPTTVTAPSVGTSVDSSGYDAL